MCRMNFCLPQTLVGINVADPANHALVEQERLDPGPPLANLPGEFLPPSFEGIQAKATEFFAQDFTGKKGDSAEAPWVHIAQLAPVVESHHHVGVLAVWLGYRLGPQDPGHPQMDQQRALDRAGPIRLARG